MIHFKATPWVAVTAVAGVVLGVVILLNLALRSNVTPGEVGVALGMGVIFWLMFGCVAWASNGLSWGWNPEPGAKPVFPELTNKEYFARTRQ